MKLIKISKVGLAVIFCLFTLNACAKDNRNENAFNSSASHEFWDSNIKQKIAKTPNNHLVALSCHNCYKDGEVELESTTAIIDAAIETSDSGKLRADLIELDIYGYRSFDGDIDFQILHVMSPVQKGPILTDVLAHENLKNSTEMLFIEYKELVIDIDFAKLLIKQLTSIKGEDGEQYAYIRKDRPIILRAGAVQPLLQLQKVLASNEYDDIRDFIKLSHLFMLKDYPDAAIEKAIDSIANYGFDMVELEYSQSGLIEAIEYAKTQRLWTESP